MGAAYTQFLKLACLGALVAAAPPAATAHATRTMEARAVSSDFFVGRWSKPREGSCASAWIQFHADGSFVVGPGSGGRGTWSYDRDVLFAMQETEDHVVNGRVEIVTSDNIVVTSPASGVAREMLRCRN